jgi:murein L,D-transpeptidase YafK
MNKIFICFLVTYNFSILAFSQSGFEKSQKKFRRVRDAYKFREAEILKNLSGHGLDEKSFRLLIMASKLDEELRLYAGEIAGKTPLKLIRTFRICSSSGHPGPKSRQGDDQVPEGFYQINRFNPISLYHLALQVSYPGKADLMRSAGQNPGGDIMIHGSCVTIGCLPMTNPGIEEIYIYAIKAKNNGQEEIPVYIFPAWPDKESFRKLLIENSADPALCRFWKNLETGYRLFKEKQLPLLHSVSAAGEYVFHPE